MERNLNNHNKPDVRRFRGLKAIYSMYNPVRISSSPPLPGGEHARGRKKERERERERQSERKKRVKLEYDSINPAIERVEWQASGQGRLSERSSR